ncbi:MAG: hypothetical protein IKK11_01530 [Oscillospiraceae bacterium]|nr:hypothetical protein [Oscillospiraceae bacterium]
MALQKKTVSTGDYAWHSWSNGYVITLELTEDSVDAATNTSLISYRFTISNTDNNRFLANGYSWDISIGGQSIPIRNFYFNLGSNYTTQEIAAGNISVAHNAAGKLDMPYAVSIPNVKAQNSYGPPAMRLSGNWELTEIPRSATVCCPVAVIGSDLEISVQRADSRFTCDLTYRFGNLQGTIAENVVTDTVSWTVPAAFYDQIPNAKTGMGEIICTTYQGDTVIGVTDCPLTVQTDPQAAQPTLTAEVTDINPDTLALTGDGSKLVRYCSTAQAVAEFCGNCGAGIADYRLSSNGNRYTDNVAVIPQTESGEFLFSVTDTRGYTRQVEIVREMIPYIQLTCNLLSSKPNGEGDMTICVKGNYFAGSFGAEENTLTVQYRYKPMGAHWQDTEQWHTLSYTVEDNAYVAEGVLTGLDYQTAYTFQARAIDRLAVAHSTEYTARATPVFDWGENDFHIHGCLRIQNHTVVDYVVERGNVGIWRYRKWAGGLVECRCLLGEDTPDWQAWGTWYEAKLQTALPFVFAQAPWILATPGAAAGNLIEATRAGTDSVEVWVCRPLATGGAYVNLYVCGTVAETIGADGAILGAGILGEMILGKGSE